MTLDNLLQIGKLKPHKTTREEIARLLAAMRRNLKDAHNVEISPESRFDISGALKYQVQHLQETMLHGKNLPAVEY